MREMLIGSRNDYSSQYWTKFEVLTARKLSLKIKEKKDKDMNFYDLVFHKFSLSQIWKHLIHIYSQTPLFLIFVDTILPSFSHSSLLSYTWNKWNKIWTHMNARCMRDGIFILCMCKSKKRTERLFHLESGSPTVNTWMNMPGLMRAMCTSAYTCTYTYILYTYIHIYIEICMCVIVFKYIIDLSLLNTTGLSQK